MSGPKSKILFYVIIGTVILISFVGMVSSAIASSRAANTVSSMNAKNPATVSALSNSANIILGAILIYLIYKTTIVKEE